MVEQSISSKSGSSYPRLREVVVLGRQSMDILLYQVHVQKIVLEAIRRVLIDILKRLTGSARNLQAATNVTLGVRLAVRSTHHSRLRGAIGFATTSQCFYYWQASTRISS